METNSVAIQILSDLVAIPSHADVQGVAEYISGRLQPLGVECRIVKRDGKVKYLVAQIGEGEPSLMFNGHMDTVPPGDLKQWKHSPESAYQEKGHLWGRGSTDAKGPLAGQIAAFESLIGKLTKGKLILLAVGEEETGGMGTQAALEDGITAQAAIVGEPSDLQVHVAHKGVLRASITVKGRASHASSPQLGSNAIMGMGKLLPQLHALHKSLSDRYEQFTGTPSLVVTTIEGGQAPNVVPETCRIIIDRRLIPGESGREAWRQLEKVVEQARVSGLKVSLSHIYTILPALTQPESPIVSSVIQSAQEAFGYTPRMEGFNACSDMTFLNQAHIPTVIFGPGDIKIAHQVNESVEMEAVEKAAIIYGKIAQNWLEK